LKGRGVKLEEYAVILATQQFLHSQRQELHNPQPVP
jgi:hypothetical protein